MEDLFTDFQIIFHFQMLKKKKSDNYSVFENSNDRIK